ncbi:MAG: hypothetical protein DWQ07_01170 [Chloroflexi bacterium]|nr:MAG: hypothetical protein DWQ07_01170 [Chloroflexota bacterium]MBL1196506.1 hypothetical protein [Chloroflexota bacterium]NOH13801.1 hypothetical protein [Chloroflexota bacterium]
MFNRISNSWELVKASARVLQADKELLIFPIISSAALILVSITFFVPSLISGFFDSIFLAGNQVLGALVAFAFYVSQYLVITYFNTALVGAALIRLRGGDPTVSDGFEIANRNLFNIIGYALIAATVGMILRWLSERSNALGRLVIGLVGLAWNLATFLAVPVLAAEGVGPIDAVKRSAQMLKKTWGEQIVGNFGLGAIFGFAYFLLIILGFGSLGLMLAAGLPIALIIILAVVVVIALVLLGLVNSTLQGIYTAALYQYASGEAADTFFDSNIIEHAFREKGTKRISL